MRILFFHRWVGVHAGGTETHVKELAFRMTQRGHEVHILTREGKELANAGLVKVWRVSKAPLESDFSYEDWRVYVYTFIYMIKAFLKLLILKLKGTDYDVVSVHFTTEAFIMRLIRKLLRWPYIFILEGYTNAEAKEAKHADLQIAISNDIAERCQRNYGYEPSVIPKGIDSERFNISINGSDFRKKYSKNSEKLALTVCRLEPRKDIPTLISAANVVCKRDPHIKFIVVGNGISRKEIEEQIKNLKLQSEVILVGEVPYFNEELPKYYRACDFFVLPTLYEGFGYVFLEAMACGLPIITTTAPAMPEVVGDAGILLPPRRPDLLAEQILKVSHDDGLRKRLIERGLERVKKYDWDNLIVEYEKAYKWILKCHKA